jgi:hypothetical protein
MRSLTSIISPALQPSRQVNDLRKYLMGHVHSGYYGLGYISLLYLFSLSLAAIDLHPVICSVFLSSLFLFVLLRCSNRNERVGSWCASSKGATNATGAPVAPEIGIESVTAIGSSLPNDRPDSCAAANGRSHPSCKLPGIYKGLNERCLGVFSLLPAILVCALLPHQAVHTSRCSVVSRFPARPSRSPHGPRPPHITTRHPITPHHKTLLRMRRTLLLTSGGLRSVRARSALPGERRRSPRS